MTPFDQRILDAVPGLTEPVLAQLKRQWHKGNDTRKVIGALAAFKVEELRNSLESCTPEELSTIQGHIAGIKTLLGAINAFGD